MKPQTLLTNVHMQIKISPDDLNGNGTQLHPRVTISARRTSRHICRVRKPETRKEHTPSTSGTNYADAASNFEAQRVKKPEECECKKP